MEDLLEKRRMSMRNISIASQELGVAESMAILNHYRYLRKNESSMLMDVAIYFYEIVANENKDLANVIC